MILTPQHPFQVSSSLLVCQCTFFCLVKFFSVLPLLFDWTWGWDCYSFFSDYCTSMCLTLLHAIALCFFSSFHLCWFVLYFCFCCFNLIDTGSGFLWFFTFICLTLLVGAPNFSTVLGMLHSGGYIKDHNGPSNWPYLGHGPLLLAHTLLGTPRWWNSDIQYPDIILYSWPGDFNQYAQTN